MDELAPYAIRTGLSPMERLTLLGLVACLLLLPNEFMPPMGKLAFSSISACLSLHPRLAHLSLVLSFVSLRLLLEGLGHIEPKTLNLS